MEFHGRHRYLSSQDPNSSSAANEEGHNDIELEMVAQECTNGAAGAEEACKNMSLDSSKFGPEFFDNLVKCIEDDNLQLLQRQKDRIDRVGLKLPTIEVRYENLCVEAESRQYSRGNHLPTIWNSNGHGAGQTNGSSNHPSKTNLMGSIINSRDGSGAMDQNHRIQRIDPFLSAALSTFHHRYFPASPPSSCYSRSARNEPSIDTPPSTTTSDEASRPSSTSDGGFSCQRC